MSVKKTYFPYYQVKTGETISMISKKFDCDPTKLLLENNLAPKQIKEGVLLKID